MSAQAIPDDTEPQILRDLRRAIELLTTTVLAHPDDLAAVQAAVDQLPPGHSVVVRPSTFVPPGRAIVLGLSGLGAGESVPFRFRPEEPQP